MSQHPLFVESMYEALDALVLGCGGYKRVGAHLWPALPADRAGRDLSDCLNPDNARKLSLDELLSLLQLGRLNNVHTAVAFLNERTGYSAPQPIDPETERQRLQREFITAASAVAKLADRIEKLAAA